MDEARKDRLLRHANYLGRQGRGSLADDLRSVLEGLDTPIDRLGVLEEVLDEIKRLRAEVGEMARLVAERAGDDRD